MEHVELLVGKTNTPLRKEFPLTPIKKIATLVLSSTFHKYAFHPMLVKISTKIEEELVLKDEG